MAAIEKIELFETDSKLLRFARSYYCRYPAIKRGRLLGVAVVLDALRIKFISMGIGLKLALPRSLHRFCGGGRRHGRGAGAPTGSAAHWFRLPVPACGRTASSGCRPAVHRGWIPWERAEASSQRWIGSGSGQRRRFTVSIAR